MAMERRRVMAKACLRLSLLLWNLTMKKKVLPQTVKATSYYCTCKGRQPSPPQEGRACASPHL